MHDTMVIAVPVLAVLFGIFLNRYDFSRLESRMDKRLDAIEASIRDLRKEMQQEFREFYRSSVQQDARIDKLENRQ